MNTSSLAVRTTNFTIAEGTFEIKTPATTRARLRMLSIISTTATAQSLGLGRPAAIGLSPTTVAFQRNDPGDPASLITGASVWVSTKPTAPTIFMRRWNFAAAIGEGIVWKWLRGEGIVIPISSALSVHNITVSVANDISAEVEE